LSADEEDPNQQGNELAKSLLLNCLLVIELGVNTAWTRPTNVFHR